MPRRMLTLEEYGEEYARIFYGQNARRERLDWFIAENCPEVIIAHAARHWWRCGYRLKRIARRIAELEAAELENQI